MFSATESAECSALNLNFITNYLLKCQCSLLCSLHKSRILLAVTHGKRRLKKKNFNISNSVLCRSSDGREQKKTEVSEFSDSVAFSGKVKSRLKCIKNVLLRTFVYSKLGNTFEARLRSHIGTLVKS